MNRPKPKVILAQLNSPNSAHTVPLASGYLKAMAHKTGLSKNVDIEIFSRNLNNVESDSRIISYITESNPIAVGFSCYVWNMDRTIYIAGQVKARIPKVKIICGGSEASAQYKKIMGNKNIDMIAIGEGELIFVELLKNFLFRAPELEKIKSIVFRKNGKIIVTPEREQIPDVNIIPSPYLSGFIDPQEYGRIMIETYRGCIEDCTYCNWKRNSSGIRYFKAERIRDEAKLAIEKKAILDIFDTVFNLPKNLHRLGKIIEEANHNKSIRLTVEGRAEYINEKTIGLLSKCNVVLMNIGLQSTNQTALSNVNRWFNKKLFIQGLDLLKKANISFRLQVIIGLPGDTADSIKKTVRFVERYSRNEDNYFEVLHVPPDTKLRKQAKGFNLKYLQKKPYYALSTNELSRREFKKLITFLDKDPKVHFKSTNKKFTPGPPLTRLPSLLQGDHGYITKGPVKAREIDDVISNIAIEIDNREQTVEQVKNLAVDLRRSIALDSQIFFKCARIDHDYPLIEEFVYQISKANPFSKLSIFIENNGSFKTTILNRLQKAVIHVPSYQECRAKFYDDLLDTKTAQEKYDIVILQSFYRKNIRNMDRILKNVSTIWNILVSSDADWKASLLELLNTPYGNVLINFEPDYINPIFIIEVLKCIRKFKVTNKRIFFSDHAVQLFYNEILIGKKPLLSVIKNFRHTIACGSSKTFHVDRYFNRTFRAYNASNGILKFIDMGNAYKRSAK